MRSSRGFRAGPAAALAAWMAAAALTCASPAAAQEPARGFGVERLYLAPAGAGWFVMDDLDMHGGLGGAMAFTSGYSYDAYRVPPSSGGLSLPVIRNQAFADFGFAITFERFRLSLDFSMPLLISGDSGVVDGVLYEAPNPNVDLGQQPDVLTDARIGFDTRVYGSAGDPLRLGVDAQLFVPNGNRADYETDGTYRAMFRGLVAGDVGAFTYAGQLGVHVRPADDAPLPNAPRGSELLFGAAAGVRIPASDVYSFVVGPEVFGATAFASFFGSTSTALEGLLTARLEGPPDGAPRLRIKLSSGGGFHPDFGAPEWRAIFAIEVSDHRSR